MLPPPDYKMHGHGSLVTRAVSAVSIVMPVCDNAELLRPANTEQDLGHSRNSKENQSIGLNVEAVSSVLS